MPLTRRPARLVSSPSSPITPSLRALNLADLEAVLCIERLAYPFPWTRGNFIDSLASGYWAQGLFVQDPLLTPADEPSSSLVAYAWAMSGVAEVHLLNLTVAPQAERRGHARCLLDHLKAWSLSNAAEQLWLEVRPSNSRAIKLYERYGFDIRGRRPSYYPAAGGLREDALLLGLNLQATPPSSVAPSEMLPP